ncbi:MAG: hypothetical protein C0524_19755 [Rhodobacter sp.]|nr:hypothetical protein [Rhodobacter sp.]
MALQGSICENGMDLIGHGLEHVLEELPGGASVRCFNELGNGELGCPVDAHEEVELARCFCRFSWTAC